MNIMFLMGVFSGVGGVETVSSVLANSFISHNHEVTICSFRRGEKDRNNKLSEKVRLLQLDLPVLKWSNIKKLRQYVLDNHIDVLIDQWCMPFTVTWLCSKAIKGTNCKFIICQHNIPNTNNHIKILEQAVQSRKGNVVINRFKLSMVKTISRLSLRYAYEKCDYYALLSPSYIPLLQAFIWKTETPKLIYMPNPITIESNFDNAVEKNNEVIYIGRIELIQKRNERLVELWSQVEALYPDWHFRIVGDGPDRSILEKIILENNLKNFSIEGFRNPVPYYKKAKILVLTSDYEGFPLSVLEGMSFGVVPLVYGSYDASYDVIDNGVNGFITPKPYSKEKTLKRLMQLIDNPALMNKMSVEAINKSKAFSLESVVKQWKTLFEKCS